MSSSVDAAVAAYGRREVVFGLRWFCPDEEGPARKLMKRYIEEIGDGAGVLDLCVVRAGSYSQFALASRAHGVKPGQMSAAAVFADIAGKEASWLVAAEIQGQIWVCVGRDGCVLPGGDRLFSEVSVARSHFNALLAGPQSFDYLYAPEDWQIMGARVFAADAVFSGAPKASARIQTVSRTGEMVRLGGLGVGLAAAVFLVRALVDPFAPGPVVIVDIIDQDPNAGLIDYVEPTPWIGAPRPETTIRACRDALLGFPTGVLDAPVSAINCGPFGVRAEYLLHKAFPHWIEEWAQARGAWRADIAEDGLSVTLARDLDAPQGPVQGEEVGQGATVIAAMRRIAAIERQRIDIGRLTPNEIPIDARDPVAKYASAAFRVSTLDPERYAVAFSAFSGIEIQGVSLSQDRRTYEINGVIHARNQ